METATVFKTAGLDNAATADSSRGVNLLGIKNAQDRNSTLNKVLWRVSVING